MRASMCSNKLLLYFFIGAFTIPIFCGTEIAVEGLPLRRQEPDTNQDILAGADFLSVLMESSLRRAYVETTSTVPPTTILVEIDTEPDYTTKRDKRNSDTLNFNSENSDRTNTNSLFTNGLPFSQSTEQFSVSDSSTNKDGVVVAVRVSSSVGKSNPPLYRRSKISPRQPYFTPDQHSGIAVVDSKEASTQKYFSTEPLSFKKRGDNNQEGSATEKPNQVYFGSEHRPSLISEVSKSELSVEESEPITKDSESAPDLSRAYSATVRMIPQFDQATTFLTQNLRQSEKQSFNPTVIYHDNPSDTNSARSVSYSSIIQTLPQISIDSERSVPHERHERNYNDAKSPYVNTLESHEHKQNENKTINWQKPEIPLGTTEKPWNNQRYTPTTPLPVELPKVYGQPEQNYEVDEELSVVTNGRAHGIQPTKPEKKDDNQKFGYVVEGKNYRKYRVEERTADGFIVGEYGVVSHDDGSLRGVRYTADGTINPRLISEALMKFLSL